MTTAIPVPQPEPPAPPTPAARRQAAGRRRTLPISGWHFLLMPTALVFVVPLVWMILTSFMPDADINRFPPRFWPSRFTTAGYQGLWTDSHILLWFRNSVIVSAIGVAAHLILCSLAGYGFARLKFYGRTMGFFVMVATIMVPTQLLMIPTFIMFSRLGVINTLNAAIIPWLTSAFGVFLMRQFFLALPSELEDAGRLDGCNQFQIFWHIVLPLAKPALATWRSSRSSARGTT